MRPAPRENLIATLGALLLFAAPQLFADNAYRDLLVDSDWLAKRIEDPATVVLEVRFDPKNYDAFGHLPGAVQVKRLEDLGDPAQQPVVRAPLRERFQETLRGWGVNDDSTLVLYDDTRTVLASRLFLLLDHFGFEQSRIKVLNGGTTEWTTFNELTREPVAIQPGNITLDETRGSGVLIDRDALAQLLAAPDSAVVLIDSRPVSEYREGHLPGAINISSIDGTDAETWTWMEEPEIAAMYDALPRDKPIVTYCNDGFRSTLGYLQLKFLGYRDVRVYDGGWPDWKRAGLATAASDRP